MSKWMNEAYSGLVILQTLTHLLTALTPRSAAASTSGETNPMAIFELLEYIVNQVTNNIQSILNNN